MKALKVGALIGGVIGLVVLMAVGAQLYPTLASSGDDINTAVGGGIGELLAGSLLAILVVAGIVFACLKVFKVV